MDPTGVSITVGPETTLFNFPHIMPVPWLQLTSESESTPHRALCLLSQGQTSEPLLAASELLDELGVVIGLFSILASETHFTEQRSLCELLAERPQRVLLQIGFDPADVYPGGIKCEAGEMMIALFTDPTGDWCMVVDQSGQRGWCPASHLAPRLACF